MRPDLINATRRASRCLCSLVAVAIAAPIALAPARALAGDGPRPRTPPLFGELPCMVVVDRGVDSSVHINYSIAGEELDKTDDEVSDGRTHQFLALAQQPLTLPLWLSAADVAAASAVGLVDPDKLTPEDVLETHPDWAPGSWSRITPDDARLPIRFDVAAAGVEWDLESVAPGVYLIDGYTWDPVFNLHSVRWSAIKIIDGDDDDANTPAALLERGDETLYAFEGETLALPGCVDALPGTTARADWALVRYAEPPSWQEFLPETPVSAGPYTLEFTPPIGIGSDNVYVRLQLHDPLGRVYTAYAPTPIAVLEQLEGATAGDDSDSDSGDVSTGGSDGDDGETDDASEPGERGCACTATRENPRRGRLLWSLTVLAALGRRRRDASGSLTASFAGSTAGDAVSVNAVTRV